MSEFFLKPIGARMIIQPDEFQHHGRIHVPDTAKRKPTTGRIVVMGDPPHNSLCIGDRVLYTQFSGTAIGFESKKSGEPDSEYRVLAYDEIIAKINDDSKLKD